MENRIYPIFRSLKSDELKQLRKIIDAPIYALSPILKQLFYLLARQRKKFDTSSIGKGKLFNELYPDKIYKDLKLRRHFSDLSKFITDFFRLGF